MAKIIRFVKGVRRHWKKSLFLSSAVAYGISYGNEKYAIRQLMREYCTEASKYGETHIPINSRVEKVLVILNPAANRKSSEEDFKDYCEPILQLAGFEVEILKTDSEGHARRYVEELESLPDAIIAAGGDGTLSETITGLKRRFSNEKCPIGVLPIGRTNTLAKNMFSTNDDGSTLEHVRTMANAAISIVRGKIQKKDVMEIQVLPNEIDEELPAKPVYAVGALQWGAFRDILAMRDKYWYTSSLRDYTAFLFNAFDDKHTWNCGANLMYTKPCSGCQNCYVKKAEKIVHNNRWWSKFIPRFSLGKAPASGPDYSKIVNEECAKINEMEIDASEIVLSTENREEADDVAKLTIKIADPVQSGFRFVADSWSRIKDRKLLEVPSDKELNVRTVELKPQKLKTNDGEKDIFYSIDNEAYEARPIKVTLVPKAVDMYIL